MSWKNTNGFMLWDLEDIRIKNEWCMSQTAAEIAKEGHAGLLCGCCKKSHVQVHRTHLLSSTAEHTRHGTTLSPLSRHVGFYLRSDIYFTKLFGEYFTKLFGEYFPLAWVIYQALSEVDRATEFSLIRFGPFFF